MKANPIVLLVLSAWSGISWAANPQVTLEIHGSVQGDIVLELYADKAPITVANFIDYVQSGFYDGLILHRVIKDFMIQGGGYDTNLVEKPAGPEIINESSNRLSNLRGTVAMARTSPADSARAQFFINQKDNAFLNYGSFTYDYFTGQPVAHIGYCVFGAVVSGMEVVDAIATAPTTDDLPDEAVIIQRATITRNAPVCASKPTGDVDADCSVDFADFVKMAQNWLSCNSITTLCN